jgi:hypothetical protein
MSLARLPSWAYTLIAALPLVAMTIAPTPGDAGIRLALNVGCLLWLFIFAIYAWVRLDETGKEAHKFAWFWGGAFALLAALLMALGVLTTPFFAEPVDAIIASYMKDRGEGQTGFAVGVLAAAFVQVIGYGLVWAAWWLSARMKR